MAKKKPQKPKAVAPAAMRGVETFDTNDTLLLVHGAVEETASSFAEYKKLKHWRKDIQGEEMKVGDPSYLVLRLAGHEWSLITACVLSQKAFLKAGDAQALSKKTSRKVIYFANSDTASATEFEVFDKGKSLERFRCFEEVEFKSTIHDLEKPEDGPEIYTFVDRLMRDQNAFAPACSIHFQAGWLEPGQKHTFLPVDEISEEMIERMDYLT